uniref:Tc1-like transposase DDE domain-containing protein n=1 Tax=Schizaphis graminum TaxID=13262 RepID=A0A2S2NGI9_SCHGA
MNTYTNTYLYESGMASTSTAGLITTPVEKKVKTLDNSRDTKKIIQNVYNFFSNCRYEQVNFNKTKTLTAEACGVSLKTVQNVLKEYTKNGKILSPRKNFVEKSSKKPISYMDDFNQDIVRRAILEFYDRSDYPTAKKVQKKLVERINYKGSVKSVERLIYNLGFRFRKCDDGRKFLTEKGKIVVDRLDFLRKMRDIRSKTPNKPIFYLDETWLNQYHSPTNYSWQYSYVDGGLKIPTEEDATLILLHVGSAKIGFIPQCKLLFKKTKNASMNNEIFREWFMNMINLLDEPSVIVMDNASYHSMETHKTPTINSKKQVIQDWLNDKNISYSSLEAKAELFEKVRINKKNKRVYQLDVAARIAGHEVVRLPPYYHYQYNPMEMIFGRIKTEIAYMNRTFDIIDVERLTHEAIDNVTVQHWKSCVEHAEKMQKEDLEKELIRESQMESVISTIIPEDDDDYSDFSDSE